MIGWAPHVPVLSKERFGRRRRAGPANADRRERGLIDLGRAGLSAFCGVRVLVVEDEPMVSLALQDTLADLGCEVAGTAARLQPALDLAQNLSFDVAVLDIDLGGIRVDPVALAIAARRLPIVFVTGYGEDAAPRDVPGPVLEKPYEAGALERALREALGAVHEERSGGQAAAGRTGRRRPRAGP
jgi:CheY-like chemotaxis protein